MNVWKKQTIHYFDKNGKQCRKANSVKRKTIESKRFYGTLRLANGKSKQMPLTEDRKSSEKLVRRLQSEADQKRALGITEADESHSRGILEALTAYVEHLRTKGNTTEYVKLCDKRLRKLFKASKTKTIGDLDAGRILKTLDGWRKTIGVGTLNHYVGASKSFSKWLLSEHQLKDDPLVGLKKQNAKTDRRRIRRAFTDDEVNALLLDTQISKKRYLGSDWQFLVQRGFMSAGVCSVIRPVQSVCGGVL